VISVYVKDRKGPFRLKEGDDVEIEGLLLRVVCKPRVGEANPYSSRSQKFADKARVVAMFQTQAVLAVVFGAADDD
jgi:hypothetical protein